MKTIWKEDPNKVEIEGFLLSYQEGDLFYKILGKLSLNALREMNLDQKEIDLCESLYCQFQ